MSRPVSSDRSGGRGPTSQGGSGHVPVLVSEVLQFLPAGTALKVVDGTLNGGGHTSAILEAHPDARILGIDWDPELTKLFLQRHPHLSEAVTVVHDSYVNMVAICAAHAFTPNVVLMDLGLSSWHYEGSERGFSFQKSELLDMRFDPTTGTSAADIINTYGEAALVRMLRELGEERFAPEIAVAIIHRRRREPILTTDALVEVIESAVPRGYCKARIHCATKTFQALRMEANHELENVRDGIAAALEVLQPGGRLLVISFHGGEDKIVREAFKKAVQQGTAKWVQRRTIQPLWEEIQENRRARSAKMKVIEKL